MNLVVDNATEVDARGKSGVKRTALGRILLKGDTISAVVSPPVARAEPATAAPASEDMAE
jgi:hypothetical protein